MGNLNNVKIKKYLNKSDELRFGCDYLRLNFKQRITFFETILHKINTTNSNYYLDGDFSYIKINTPMGRGLQVIYSYNKQAIPIIFYADLQRNLSNPLSKKTKDELPQVRIDFYGSLFRLLEVGEFKSNFIQDYISTKSEEDPNITRYDYCIDMFHEKKTDLFKLKHILPGVREDSQNFHHYFGNKENSRSLGQTKNKRYVIRAYDKLLDIMEKRKYGLYGDYFKYKSVHRYELEFNNSFCKGYTLSRLSFLEIKAKTAMKIGTGFNGKLFYKYNSKYEINEFNKQYLTKIFTGKAKKFALAGFNPYILIYSAFMNDQEINKDLHFDYLEEFIKYLPMKGVF